MAVTYLRLFPATQQFELRNGQLNVAGRLNVFYESTDDLADLYDENGTQLAQPVILDDNGRARGLFVDSKKVYRLEVYDQFGELLYTVRKMVPSGGGTGSALGKVYDVVSNDGSILVDKFDEGGTTTFDLSLGIDANELKPSCLRASAAPVTTDGQFVFDQLVREGNLLSVDQSGKVRMEPAWYHFTAVVELSYDGTPVNEAHQVTLWTTLSNSVIDLDTSYAHRESIELSGDIHVVGNNTEFPLGVSGLDTGITASLMSFDIHAVTGHEGNNEYHAGEGITIVNATKTISADFDSVQEKLVAGENISITGNVISAGSLTQEQSDWTEDDTTSPAYIKNKPNLDIYATQAQLTYGLAGKQNTIPDLAQIRAGAASGSSAVQPSDLATVATTGDYNTLNNRPNLTVYATKTEVNTGLAAKQDVISDLSTIRSGASAGATAVQPADLNAYATDAELAAGLAGKQDVLTPGDNITISNNVISATDQRQADWSQSDSSAVDYIRNKPDLSAYATDAELAAGLATKQDTINDLSTIRSGAAAGATALQPSDVATVATTGNYNDLTQKPTIPSGTQLVPSATSADADKVLTVDAQGVPAWAEAQAPISAGDGISISNNVVSAKVDGTTVTVNASGELQAAAAVTVDQTYDPTSTNPQSGTAVAEAVAGVDTGLFEAQYGITPFADIAAAITAKKVVYCKVSPQVGVAFLAYYDIYGYTDDYIEFQYYRSNSDASEADSVFVYDVTRGNVWTTTEHVAQVQPDWDAAAGSFNSIANKPDLSVYATTQALTTGLASKQDTISDLATIRSGAAEGATAVQPGDLATVATTGSYDDLVDKPTIPAAQVNSDWNSNSGVSQILNKPTLATVATTGDYDDLSNKPSIPAAQVNSDWNAVSGVSEILNKPTLATVATSGSYTDLSNKPDLSVYAESADLATVATTGDYTDLSNTPTIPSGTQLVPAATSADADKVLTVNSQGTPAWATGGGDDGADWDAEQGEPGYIENKPVPKTLTAGTGISITENASTITIANTATPPTVDQTYDASSTNAQSGVAVAEAIAALGTWTDVSSEITKSTTIITGGSITFRYNAILKLISLIGEIHVQGDGDVYALPEKYRPQTNFTCANPGATSYIDYTPSTGKFVARSGTNGYFSWTMTMPCLGE